MFSLPFFKLWLKKKQIQRKHFLRSIHIGSRSMFVLRGSHSQKVSEIYMKRHCVRLHYRWNPATKKSSMNIIDSFELFHNVIIRFKSVFFVFLSVIVSSILLFGSPNIVGTLILESVIFPFFFFFVSTFLYRFHVFDTIPFCWFVVILCSGFFLYKRLCSFSLPFYKSYLFNYLKKF